MLGKFGETLVVDWGLAKAGIMDHSSNGKVSRPVNDEQTLRPSSGSSVEKTQTGATLGTAHFMSPEQAEGNLMQLGPASDIFSLGSTLYVLLTGHRPFECKDDVEVLTRVRACRFTPPIEAKPGTPPALNAICLKAMAHQPADRYATALELAADVEHWLADEPVASYREPLMERLGRWGRRHRTPLVGAAAILVSAVLALSISTGLIWAEQQKTAEQKQLAEDRLVLVEAEQKKTAEQKRLAEDRLVLVEAEQKKTAEQKQLAEDNLALAVAEQAKTAEQKQIADKNYVLARDVGFNSIDLIESTQVELASNPAWQAKRKEILVTAARSCQRFLEHEPHDLVLQTKAAKVYRYTANFHRLENDIAAAEPLYRESIRLQQKLLDKCAYEPKRFDELVATLRDQGNLLVRQGKLKAAAQNYALAIRTVQKLQDKHADDPAYDRSIATAQLDLAALEFTLGNGEKSRELAQSAADLFEQLLKVPAPQRHAYDPLLRAIALTRVAMVERETDVKKARTTHNAAAKILKAMVEEKPASVVMADILHYQAHCRVEQALTLAKVPEKRADAETNLAAAVVQWQSLSKNYDKVPQYRAGQANASLLLGGLRGADKRNDEAEKDFELARKLLVQLVEEFPKTPSYHADLGRAYAELGQLARIKLDYTGAAGYFHDADRALSQAVKLSPDDPTSQKARAEVRKAVAQIQAERMP
jgi:tetratricopeptide (TPR) repeat protein